MRRYSIIHPEVTPEAYISRSSDSKSNYVKGVYIPSSISQYVKIIYADPQNVIKEYLHPATVIDCVPINPYCHMYVDMYSHLDQNSMNIVATKLYRHSYVNIFGSPSKDIIHGPVLLYGSYSSLKKLKHLKDHSVPYEIVEQIFRLYQNDCYEL